MVTLLHPWQSEWYQTNEDEDEDEDKNGPQHGSFIRTDCPPSHCLPQQEDDIDRSSCHMTHHVTPVTLHCFAFFAQPAEFLFHDSHITVAWRTLANLSPA